MPEVNLDKLVVVNLITNPRAATAADLKTVLTLDPEWTEPGVSEFRSLRQFDDAHPSAGVMTRARIAAALNQDRVASVKIAGADPLEDILDVIEEIRSIDDGWIALHLLASIDATNTAPAYIPHADAGAVAELFEVQREKFLIVDAIDTKTPTGNPSTAALKTAVGRGEFTAVFLDGPNSTAVPAQNPSRYLHGIATTAKVLAMDPDRRSAAFSWQKLNFCDPSFFAPEFFPANEGWANFYGVNRGLALTAKGVNAAGNPAHGTISALWFKYRVGERITSNMAEYSDRYGKIPFDKNGIGIVAAAVDRVLWDAENNGHAVAGSGRYNAPAVEDVPALDYAAGHYAMQAGFRILGSIVSVELDGVVTLAFTGSDIGITE